jgi:hypothetical protein
MKTDLLKQFAAARRAGVPLVAVRTPDPEALMTRIQATTNGAGLVMWDCVRGALHRNEGGKKAVTAMLSNAGGDAGELQNATFMAESARFAPENTVFFMVNAHRYLDTASYVQALCNLRDPFKESRRMMVLLAPEVTLPSELKHDVVQLDEPLPDEQQLEHITKETLAADLEAIAAAKGKPYKIVQEQVDKTVDAVRGLSAFAAEQTVAMSLTAVGVDVEQAWERKRQQLSSRKGLTVWRGGEKFADLGGLTAVKQKLCRILAGRRPPRVVVWVDEGEKTGLGSGAEQDLSGTSTDQMSVLLAEMQDKDYTGIILDGVPGSGKSAFAKAVGNEAGVLTVRLDLGANKGEGLIGQAENEIRENMKVVEAIGGEGGAFFVMTSNNSRALKPELRSRFHKGIWFFDLPTPEERQVIWNIYLRKFGFKGIALGKAYGQSLGFDDADWTGREIRSCVATAWEENITLAEAAAGIIPIAVSDRVAIQRMQTEADGKYSSASYPGVYRMPSAGEDKHWRARRHFAHVADESGEAEGGQQ